MHELDEIIRGEIARAGAIPFERFMELALYHPEFGYYRRERARPRAGRAGDFFTSVSVGPLFGRLLARQFLEMWERLGKPAEFRVIEQGAEDAQLARDALAWCEAAAPEFFAAVRYGIVEGLALLRARQGENLAAGGFAGKANWFSDGAELARAEPVGIFFSNELVDAFPVRRVVCRGGEWREFYVGLDAQGNFAWREEEIRDDALRETAETLPRVEGGVAEISLRARRWMEEVGGALKRGYVVTSDYGYEAAEFRGGGTLTAYREHRRAAEILAEPGGQDITAHVDFTALARAGERGGLVTLGLVDQQRFLTGIAYGELEGAAGPGAGVAENLRAWQTLTHPNHLGTRFRALVQGKDAPGGLAGLRYARPAPAPG